MCQRLIALTSALLLVPIMAAMVVSAEPKRSGPTFDCATVAGPGARDAGAPRRGLGGTAWVLVEFQSMDDTTLRPAASARYSLTFNADGRLEVQADCERGRSSWRSPDNVSLEIGPIALTRARCRPSPLHDRFARDLAFVRSYVVRDGNLYLSLMADGGIYAFEPIAPPPAR